MIFYRFYSGDTQEFEHYTKKSDALTAAMIASKADPDFEIEVERIVTPPLTRSLFLDVINNQGFVISSKRIATFENGKET